MSAVFGGNKQDFIASNNKIQQALLRHKRNMYELVTDTGLAQEEIARCMHYLRKQDTVYCIDFAGQKYYSLTDKGKLQAPKKSQRDFLAKNTPRITGRIHVEGVPGKQKVDKDGAIILKLDSAMGGIYDVLGSGSLTAFDLVDKFKTTRSTSSVQNALTYLCRLELINWATVSTAGRGKGQRRGARLYSRTDKPAVIGNGVSNNDTGHTGEVSKNDMHLHAPQVAAKTVKTVSAPLSNETIITPDTGLEDCLDVILNKHSINDVMFALFVRLDTETRELRDFVASQKKFLAKI